MAGRARTAGDGSGADVRGWRGRAARADRGPARERLRGAVGDDVPGPVRAAAARRGAGGGDRPVRHAGRRRRPAGDAARADRRPAAAPPRPARQPERDARRDRVADRPAQGRADLRRRLRRLGGNAARRRPRRARARVRGALRGATTRCSTTRGCSTSATSCCTPSGCCARSRTCARGSPQRYRHVLVDELQDTSFAQGLLLRLLVSEHGGISAFADDDQAVHRFRGAATKNVRDFRAEWPLAAVVRLERSHRAGATLLQAAAAVVEPIEDRLEKALDRAEPGGEVAFWRCASDRAQAQAVAADVERLIAREDVAPEDICVLVRSVRAEGQQVAVAFEERAVPYHLSGAAAFFQRAEVRDLLAWLRLLVDPGDAGAVVRALARPPVELRSIDLARVTQIARRRKLDMVAALSAALESPQIPPEARERIVAFLKLYRSAAAALDSVAPGSLRPPADRAARAAPPAAVRRLDRGRRAAAQPRAFRRAGGRVRAPRAAGHGARVRALDRRGRRRGAARGGGRAAGGRARRARDDDARRQGAGVRPRLRARPDVGAHARPAPAGARADPGRADQGDRPAAVARGAQRRDAAAAVRRDDARARRGSCSPTRSGPTAAPAQPPSPFVEEARAAVGGEWEAREEELFGPAETLQSTFRILRDELLTTVAQVGGRLGELRFDTDLDVSHAVVRYLELLKLAALLERTRGGEQSVGEAAAGGQRAAAGEAPPPSSARSSRRQRAGRLPARRRARRAAAPEGGRGARRSRRWRRSCRGAARGSCCPPPTSRPTGRAR